MTPRRIRLARCRSLRPVVLRYDGELTNDLARIIKAKWYATSTYPMVLVDRSFSEVAS